MKNYRMIAAMGMLALADGSQAATTDDPLFYVSPHSSTVQAATGLEGQAKADTLALAEIATAIWFTTGSPAEIEARVKAIVDDAEARGKVPVLVAYNIPFRDCALYSAGGASDTADYLAWIRGFAAGIGERQVIIALEPDSLGIIPWHKDYEGNWEGCRPDGIDQNTASRDRFTQLWKAVDILAALPGAKIYLDGTTSSWLASSEATSRLIKANIAKADGFFLNVSNFESDDRVIPYAGWLSDCLALVLGAGLDPRECPSQYYPADFEDTRSWSRTSAAYDRLFDRLGTKRNPAAQKRAIIDTSRNGQGSWTPPHGRYRDAEVWCNPPDRGLGRLPTSRTGHAYVDAFLWIKIPGESDGRCHRGTAGPNDPERRILAPAAGHWFPEQARELIEHAVPPFPE